MVWLPYSPRWRFHRRIANTEIFAAKKLDASQGLRCRKVHELAAHVRDNCQTRSAVDIGQAAFITTLNLISNTILSTDLASFDSGSAQELKALVHRAMEEGGRPNPMDYFPILRRIDPQGIRRRMAINVAGFYKLFDEIIDQRLECKGRSLSLLEARKMYWMHFSTKRQRMIRSLGELILKFFSWNYLLQGQTPPRAQWSGLWQSCSAHRRLWRKHD
uniref:Geraniol 8-hydroxylase-like n=1 Tax=Nelumbo nucifera TaxID=4432 RepID=A0A822YC09_NELNU|nr:TPA_asm: hypothetical protein HUJ06_030519 [Nelumbo nucifera]